MAGSLNPLSCSSKRRQQPAFSGTQVVPAKAKRDRRRDRQIDDGQSDPYVALCFAGTTKTSVPRNEWAQHKQSMTDG